MRIIAFVTNVDSIQRILAYLGEATQPPPVAPAARGPPGWEEDCDTREGDTFALSQRERRKAAREWPCGARGGRNDRTLPANPGMDASHPEYEFDQRVSW